MSGVLCKLRGRAAQAQRWMAVTNLTSQSRAANNPWTQY
jgi:hypothetical protein